MKCKPQEEAKENSFKNQSFAQYVALLIPFLSFSHC